MGWTRKSDELKWLALRFMFINLFQSGHLYVSLTVEWILARQFERMRCGWKWLRIVLVMDRDEGEFWSSNICFTVARNGFRMHLKQRGKEFYIGRGKLRFRGNSVKLHFIKIYKSLQLSKRSAKYQVRLLKLGPRFR
jgi:hypothetical protein